MTPFANDEVARVFAAYPEPIRARLLALRQLIFDTAASTDGVGHLDEMLKWGEPAYLTSQSKSGSTIRIHSKKASARQYAIYFNCQSTLVDTFRSLFPEDFTFEGNRALVLDAADEPPMDALAFCIGEALTYHRKKRPA